MKDTHHRVKFWRMLGVVLSGLLVLSVCTTAVFAEQAEPMLEDVVASGNPVAGVRGTDVEGGLRTMGDHTISVDNKYRDDNWDLQSGTVYGEVTTSAPNANQGDTVTLTVKPEDDELYTLYKIEAANANVSEERVSLIKGDNNTYSFQMTDFDVIVTAIFRKRHFHGDEEFEPWTRADGLPSVLDTGNYYLTSDVTLEDSWTAPYGGSVPTNLCLNGHSITLNQSSGNPKPVVSVADNDSGIHSKLVLYDEDASAGTITHAQDKTGCGVRVVNGGEFVMKGGNISGNVAETSGGGVFVGKEDPNKNGGTFILDGGAITNNKGYYRGGGVAVEGGTFKMTSGIIQNNGDDSVKYGGGVWVKDGEFNLSGGTITNNTARIGGGVAGEFTYQICVSGSPSVTDNHAASEYISAMGDNLCLMWPQSGNDIPITIGGALQENAKIGISMLRDNSPAESSGSFIYTDGIFTTGYKAAQNTDPWNYFTSDNPDLRVLWIPDGTEAQLAVPRHISVAQGITGGTVTLSKDVAAEGETITIQATPNNGWELVSVTAKDDEGKVPVTDNKELVVRASNVVVFATFREKTTPPAPPTPLVPVDIHTTYTAHVQDKGDLPVASDGEVIGTIGESRRLEAMSATVDTGGIEYRAHLQDKGWDSWVADGKQAGTIGESRRLEAIQMKLTGSAATGDYHVWYRVHSQDFDWLGWACDGEPAGTTGMSKRVEAYQVLVLQGDAKPEDYDASKPAYRTQTVANAHLQGSGWTGNTSAGIIGTTGQSRRMEGLRLTVSGQPFEGAITYQVHERGNGWTAEKSDGALAGTTGESRRIEAVRIHLTGELAGHLSVWYRVHSQDFGWSGWACDGAPAGTEGLSKRAEAVDIQILSKDASAPGSTANALRT